MGVVEQVSEATNPDDSLRWLELSRACPRKDHSHWQGIRGASEPLKTCEYCGVTGYGSGRVPDVTLEKVTKLLLETIGFVGFQNVDDGRFCAWLEPDFPDIAHHGDTPLEAACEALLATFSPEPSTPTPGLPQ